jgi:hypothetical protein
MNNLPFSSIEQTPNQFSSTNVISRFVQGLGFRFRWATEGLTLKEHEYRPTESSMNIRELLEHLFSMAIFVNSNLGGNKKMADPKWSFEELRGEILKVYADIDYRLKSLTDNEFEKLEKSRMENGAKASFWLMLNGPIADSLTHVGQITSWRRISGNPQPRGVNVFKGTTNL